MLVLTRKPHAGESSVITIGNAIEVTVLEVQGDSVRLGVMAPKETPVHRTEVWHQIKAKGHPRNQSAPK